MPRRDGFTIRETRAQRRRRVLRLLKAATVVPPKPRKVKPKVDQLDA